MVIASPTRSADPTPARTDRTARTRRILQLVVLVVPALAILIGGWRHRWMNEDAFINLRIVDQIFAGHGPVFNAGERVEAYTSPLWLGVLVGVRATLGQVLRMEWATVVASLAFSTGAFVVAAAAARRLHDRREFVVPLGIGVIAAVPVVWDFSTAGLETGLTWLWLAGSWLALVHAARAARPPEGRILWASLVVLGLGPVVRPDLGLISVCVLAAFLVIVRPPARRLPVDLAIAFALPLLYQVFRMGYFASLVPSTALAKDAGGVHFGQGWDYVVDLFTPYRLWLPMLVLVAVIAGNVVRGTSAVRIACAGMLGGALLHATYITVVGGDYMHGRLLLPALFAFVLPASLGIAPDRFRAYAIGAVVVVAVWAIVCAGWLRFDQTPATRLGVSPISDWRIVLKSQVVHDEQPNPVILTGEQVHRLWEDGQRGFVPLSARTPVPGKLPDKLVVVFGSIGVPAYHAGGDVWVVDIGGLAEPIASRTDVTPGAPAGHRKQVAAGWYAARFAENPHSPKAQAAVRALQCGRLAELLDAIEGPITPSTFVGNLFKSVGFTRMHIPRDPREAEAEFCS